MVDLPTISVILPTRDRPEYLLAAVGSVLAQRVLPTELLVVDDGSGEDALEALGPLSKDSKVPSRVLAGPGRGPAAARNVGLREAAGELVAFLDDDDLWLPQKLEWQLGWLAERPKLG
nr:glycosyltransferase [Gemmatimonadales bacterium]